MIRSVPVLVVCPEGITSDLSQDIASLAHSAGGEVTDEDGNEIRVEVPENSVDSFCEQAEAVDGVEQAFVPDSYYE